MKKNIFWTILGIIFLGIAGFTYVYKKIVQDIPVPPLTEVTAIADIVQPYIANEMTKGLSIGTYQGGAIKFYKSFIVAKDKVESIVGNQVAVGEKMLPISTRMKKEVLDKLTGDRLLKK